MLVQVSVSDLLAAVQPVRLITGSVEKAPVPFAIVGGGISECG